MRLGKLPDARGGAGDLRNGKQRSILIYITYSYFIESFWRALIQELGSDFRVSVAVEATAVRPEDVASLEELRRSGSIVSFTLVNLAGGFEGVRARYFWAFIPTYRSRLRERTRALLSQGPFDFVIVNYSASFRMLPALKRIRKAGGKVVLVRNAALEVATYRLARPAPDHQLPGRTRVIARGLWESVSQLRTASGRNRVFESICMLHLLPEGPTLCDLPGSILDSCVNVANTRQTDLGLLFSESDREILRALSPRPSWVMVKHPSGKLRDETQVRDSLILMPPSPEAEYSSEMADGFMSVAREVIIRREWQEVRVRFHPRTAQDERLKWRRAFEAQARIPIEDVSGTAFDSSIATATHVLGTGSSSALSSAKGLNPRATIGSVSFKRPSSPSEDAERLILGPDVVMDLAETSYQMFLEARVDRSFDLGEPSLPTVRLVLVGMAP